MNNSSSNFNKIITLDRIFPKIASLYKTYSSLKGWWYFDIQFWQSGDNFNCRPFLQQILEVTDKTNILLNAQMNSEKRKSSPLMTNKKGTENHTYLLQPGGWQTTCSQLTKGLGFKNLQKVRKQGLGPMWNRDGIHAHAHLYLQKSGPFKGWISQTKGGPGKKQNGKHSGGKER